MKENREGLVEQIMYELTGGGVNTDWDLARDKSEEIITLVEQALSDKWVSCEERLPEHIVTVIGSIDRQVLPVYYHYPTESWFASFDDDMKFQLEITHWQPFPSPPQE